MSDLLPIKQFNAYEAKCAEATMLRKALGQIANTESYKLGPTSLAYEVAAKALVASTDDWLERHDAEFQDTIKRLRSELTQMEDRLDTVLARAEKAEAECDTLRSLAQGG